METPGITGLETWLVALFGLVAAAAGAVAYRERRRCLRAAGRLLKLEREHELVLRSISDNVTYLDRDLRVIWTNWTDGGKTTPGPEQPVRRGDVCHQVIAGQAEPCAGCPVPLVLKSGLASEGVVECRDGTLLRLCAAPVRDDRGDVVGVVQTARDITEKRRLAERMQRLQKMEAVGQLAAGVAHDFNNCLQVILGHTELLASALPDGDPTRASSSAVLRAGEQARNVVNRLLTFSRTAEPRLEACDLASWVGGQVQLLRRVVPAPIEVTVSVAGDLPPVTADPAQVDQVLASLVVNARDAMPDGGRIEVALAPVDLDAAEARERGAPLSGRFVELRVADEGTGIPPELLDRIFEPFFTTKGVEQGTGLGLATVYGIVAAHHGYISVQSEPGRGTTFRVGWPAADTVPLAPAASAPSIQGRILLVEDDPAVRDLALTVLRRAGHEVEVAGDGHAAVQLLERPAAAYDAAVLDVMLPGMNGWAVYNRARARHPDLRVVFCSGHSPALLSSELAVELGGREFLQKPYRPDDLLARVQAVLEDRRR